MPRWESRESRFFDNISFEPMSGCWLWVGATDSCGYGRIRIATHKTQAAHRYSYQLHVGNIESELYVCHKCDNPTCVNTEHLFVGTQKDNMLDCVIKGRHRSQEVTHCPRGHAYEGDNLVITHTERGNHRQRMCKICHRESSRLAMARMLSNPEKRFADNARRRSLRLRKESE